MIKKQLRFLDKCLIFVGACLGLFIIMMIITYWKFQAVPDTLITAVLGTGGVELIVSSFIAISGNLKRKGNTNDTDSNDSSGTYECDNNLSR